jgi:hypothetical protein
VGLGALAGGIGGAIGGGVGFKVKLWDLPGRIAAQVISGSVSGGIASVINGGSFGQGLAWGAAGAAIASVAAEVIRVATRVEKGHGKPLGEPRRVSAQFPMRIESDVTFPEGAFAYEELTFELTVDSEGNTVAQNIEIRTIKQIPEGSNFDVGGEDFLSIPRDKMVVRFGDTKITPDTFREQNPPPGVEYIKPKGELTVTGIRYRGPVSSFELNFAHSVYLGTENRIGAIVVQYNWP